MSRLIVKNLPAYLDEARLKQHFNEQSASALTDVKIVRRPDGTSRRFGFVGFKDQKEAEEALQYFDRTFIDTARINVSVAKAINDDGLQAEQAKRRGRIEKLTVEPSSTSTGAKDNPQQLKVENKDKKKSKKAISFEEFMDVMKPKSKRKAWSNGDVADADTKLDSLTFTESDSVVEEKKRKRRKMDSAKEAREATAADEVIQANEPNVVANDDGLTDLEYMYKRMKRNVGQDLEEKQKEKMFEQSDDEEDASVKPTLDEKDAEDNDVDEADALRHARRQKALEEKARKDQDDTDSIMQSGRLFVRNLPFDASEHDLEKYFATFGEVVQAHITLDKKSKKSKGIAFVSFKEPSQALIAFRAADGHTFQGRLLHILPAVQKGEVHAPTTVRDQRNQTLKANAAKDFNWSTLYMNSDAVASSVAARLGIDKADIVNPTEEEGAGALSTVSPAVRLALAETSVINETRDYLESEGINLAVFDSSDTSRRRSDTVILVKNIPFGTDAATLQSMFEKHGTVEQTIMPPSATIAIVEMQVAGEAKVAFKALAYKRLGNSVLYLEKAPNGIMSGTRSAPAAGAVPKETEQLEAAKTQSAAQTANDTAATDAATLFIKNLSFSTTEERLTSAFDKVNDVLFVRIQKRQVNKRDGRGSATLSMGYGFVGFPSVDAARLAQKKMDKTVLDGHVLFVSMARRGHDGDDDISAPRTSAAESDVAPSSKLIVKNLAFQATKKDVRALFAAHGKLKSVRVPRKGLANGGGTAAGVRGFGFVEFVNRNEAMHAYRALRHSHLLGRHLVLEWDTEGSGISADDTADSTAVERLRRKAAQSAAASAASAAGTGAHRREKLRLGEEDIKQAARNELRRKAEDDDDDDDNDDDKDED